MQLGRNDAATLRSQGSGLGAFSPASPTVSTGQRRAAEDSASPVWEGNAAPMQPAATMQTSPDFMVQQHLQQTSSHASVETGQLQPQQPQPPNQQQEEQQEQQQGVPGPVEVCCLGDSLMRGVFFSDRYLDGLDCIQLHSGAFVSRSAFEKMSGSCTAKWHCSIKVMADPSKPLALGHWLAGQGLPIVKGTSRRSRKRRMHEAVLRSLSCPEPLPPAEELDNPGPTEQHSQQQLEQRELQSQQHHEPPEPQLPRRRRTASGWVCDSSGAGGAAGGDGASAFAGAAGVAAAAAAAAVAAAPADGLGLERASTCPAAMPRPLASSSACAQPALGRRSRRTAAPSADSSTPGAACGASNGLLPGATPSSGTEGQHPPLPTPQQAPLAPTGPAFAGPGARVPPSSSPFAASSPTTLQHAAAALSAFLQLKAASAARQQAPPPAADAPAPTMSNAPPAAASPRPEAQLTTKRMVALQQFQRQQQEQQQGQPCQGTAAASPGPSLCPPIAPPAATTAPNEGLMAAAAAATAVSTPRWPPAPASQQADTWQPAAPVAPAPDSASPSVGATIAHRPTTGPTHPGDRDPYPPGAPPSVQSNGSGYAGSPTAWRPPQLLPPALAAQWQQRGPALHLRPLTAPAYVAAPSPNAWYRHVHHYHSQHHIKSPTPHLPEDREDRWWASPGGAMAAGNVQGSSRHNVGGGSGQEPTPLTWSPSCGPVTERFGSGGGGGGGNGSRRPGPWPTATCNHPAARPTPFRLATLPGAHPAWGHQQPSRGSGSGSAAISPQSLHHSPMLLDPATAAFANSGPAYVGAQVEGSSAAVAAAGSSSGIWQQQQQQQQGLPSPPGSWHVSAPTTPPAGASVPQLRSSGSAGLHTCWSGGCVEAGEGHRVQDVVSAEMQQQQQHHHQHHQSHQPEQLVGRSSSHDVQDYLQSFLLEVLQEDEQQQQLPLQQQARGLPVEAAGAGADLEGLDGGEGADGLLDMLWSEGP